MSHYAQTLFLLAITARLLAAHEEAAGSFVETRRAAVSTFKLPEAYVARPYSQPLPLSVPHGSHPTYQLLRIDGQPLDSWLKLSDGQLTGLPPIGDTGDLEFFVRVAVADIALPDARFSLHIARSPCDGNDSVQLSWCGSVMAPINAATQKEGHDTSDQPDKVVRYRTKDPDSHCANEQKSRYQGCIDQVQFDRRSNTVIPDEADARRAILGSKVLLSGTVLYKKDVNSCKSYDWKVVTQSKESSAILVYNPNDFSAFCGSQDNSNSLFVVLPVHVVWAEVIGYPVSHDAGRMELPPAPEQIKLCSQNKTQPPIRPCNWPTPGGLLYNLESPLSWLYNHVTTSGTAQGTLSFSPIIGNGAQNLIGDFQYAPATKLGIGWLGMSLTYEKNTQLKADLNSFVGGINYNIKLLKRPGLRFGTEDRLLFRPPELIFGTGIESATTRPPRLESTLLSRGRDLNYVGTGYLRLPVTADIHRQPSVFSAFPVVGVEGGEHLKTHMLNEPPNLLRLVTGVDASARWPFIRARAFFGDRPSSLDFSYRTRWLAYEEPYTDATMLTAPPMPAPKGPVEQLSRQRRSYTRITYNFPVSTYAQFRVSVQKGSLAPVFHSIPYSVTLGLNLLNPGLSEH